MWAAAENHAAVVRVLSQAGADIKARSKGGVFTPFLFAVRGGQIDAARALLDAGADVNETLPDGTSALIVAVMNAHYELAAVLLEKGADPNAAAQGWTALHQIAWTRRPNYGYNLPGPVPTGQPRRPRPGVKSSCSTAPTSTPARRRSRGTATGTCSTGSARRRSCWRPRRWIVPLMRALLEQGADPKLGERRRHDAADGRGRRRHLGAGREPRHRGGSGCRGQAAAGDRRRERDRRGQERLHGAARRGPPRRLDSDRAAAGREGCQAGARNNKGWLPLTIAEGIEYTPDIFKRYPETAEVLRQMMRERGLAGAGAGSRACRTSPARRDRASVTYEHPA